MYALGAILHAMLTGEPPFSGSLMALMVQIATEPPAPPSLRRPEVPAAIDAIVLRALAKAPEARFATMGAMASVLEQTLSAPRPLDAQPAADDTTPDGEPPVERGGAAFPVYGADYDTRPPDVALQGAPPTRGDEAPSASRVDSPAATAQRDATSQPLSAQRSKAAWPIAGGAVAVGVLGALLGWFALSPDPARPPDGPGKRGGIEVQPGLHDDCTGRDRQAAPAPSTQAELPPETPAASTGGTAAGAPPKPSHHRTMRLARSAQRQPRPARADQPPDVDR